MRLPLCNGRPDRAPCVFGRTFPLCWRCSAAILAMLVTLQFAAWLPDETLWWLVPLCIPAAWDGVRQYGFGVESTNSRRFWTGFLLGTSALSCGLIARAHLVAWALATATP